MITLLNMTGPRALIPAEPTEHPLRAALARGDRLLARSGPALLHLLHAEDDVLVGDAIVAQVGGMLADLARQLSETSDAPADSAALMLEILVRTEALRAHCHALALEWRLALRLENDLALDPVLSPLLQTLVSGGDTPSDTVAMAALSAQARFAQAQRRMQLPLGELPAELFHAALMAAKASLAGLDPAAERQLRSEYDEAAGRLALLGRLAQEMADHPSRHFALEEAGIALWLSALAMRSGQSRERIACAAVDPQLGRLLLTLRAAGLGPGEAERQAVLLHPDAALPRGLHDVGTREAAQWLEETSA